MYYSFILLLYFLFGPQIINCRIVWAYKISEKSILVTLQLNLFLLVLQYVQNYQHYLRQAQLTFCDGFKITLPLVLVIISMTLSVIFLGLATRTIPMSIAYAVWTGIGIIGVFTYGLFILKDPIS